MKNKISIFSFLTTTALLASNQLVGQDSDVDRKFRFGLKTSGNISWVKPENKLIENHGASIGYSWGLMADYKFGKNYAVSFGLDVQNLNNKIKFLTDTTSLTTSSGVGGKDTTVLYPASSIYKNNFGYVNLPVVLRMSTPEIGYMTYFANFGLELGVNYKAMANIESTISKPSGLGTILTEDYDISGLSAFFRTALVIGGGFEYNIAGKTNLMVGITYSNGFSNLFSKKNSIVDPKVENRSILFDTSGNLKYDNQGKLLVEGEFKKAYSRYVALNVGIFF